MVRRTRPDAELGFRVPRPVTGFGGCRALEYDAVAGSDLDRHGTVLRQNGPIIGAGIRFQKKIWREVRNLSAQERQSFDLAGLGHHVDRLDGDQSKTTVDQHRQIAGEGRRVARKVGHSSCW